MSSHLTLQVFGSTKLLDKNGVEIRFTSKHPLLILAILSEHSGQPLQRSELASIVWQNSMEKSAKESLRNALSQIRKVLPPEALESDVAAVMLEKGFVEVVPQSTRAAFGEFMPEFSQDWVLDRRFRYRADAVNIVLQKAITASNVYEKLALAEQACAIDPRSSKAMRLRDQLLREIGEVELAIEKKGQYRRRIMREFGALPTEAKHASHHSHPLLETARWALKHDPKDALQMIAATANQWQYLPIDESRAVIGEATQHRHLVSDSEYREAYGQYMFLSAMSGTNHNFVEAEAELNRCESENEATAGARLARALGYNRLSKGDFVSARQFAKRAQVLSQQGSDKGLQAQTSLDASVILFHSGRTRESRHLYQSIRKFVFDHCTAEHIASYLIIDCDFLVERGKYEEALDGLDFSRRTYEAYGKSRMEPWLLISEAYLSAHIGDFHAAKAKLEQCLDLSSAMGGQAAVAMANERLATVNCELKEYVSAVEALARAKKMRKQVGTVRSVVEAQQMRPVRKLITQNLHERDIARAYYRVLESA